MQNKGFVKVFAVLLTLVCLFYLSFSVVTNYYYKKASDFAQGNLEKENYYLDSLSTKKVWLGYTLKKCRSMELNLGLDLKGGMNVIMEVDAADVLKSLSNNNPDRNFNKALANAKVAQQTSQRDFISIFADEYRKLDPGARLSAIFSTFQLKDRITPQSTDNQVVTVLKSELSSAIDNSFKVLRTRIDKFGVVAPNIQKMGNNGRISLELPGVKDPSRVRKLLQGSANLEFWETYELTELYQPLMAANDAIRAVNAYQQQSSESTATNKGTSGLKAGSKAKPENAKTPVKNGELAKEDSILANIQNKAATKNAAGGKSNNIKNEEQWKKQYPLFAVLQLNQYNGQIAPGPAIGVASYKDTATVDKYLNLRQVKDLLPRDVIFRWSVKSVDEKEQYYQLVALKVTNRDGKAALAGDVVSDAKDDFSQNGGSAEVSMTMNGDGAKKWARLTKDNIGRCIAIVLDGSVYSYPRVNDEITGGRSSITGNFTPEEAKDLANVLNSGKMSAPARIVQEDVIGPSLGQEAINSGLIAFGLALAVLLIYLIVMYGLTPGVIADGALLLNLFFTLGILASFKAVLTLSGIAGLILSLALAVDANVLIYERIKEELRGGRSMSNSIKEGYHKAFSAIFDSNLSAIITGAILYIFGTGPIRGFATTYIFGIVTSFFTSVWLTRIVYENGLKKGKYEHLTFTTSLTKNFLVNPNFAFIKTRKFFFILSIALTVVSLAFLGVRGLNQGIDFTGGRNYVVRFDKPINTVEVQEKLSPLFPDHLPTVITIGAANQIRVSTNYKIENSSEGVDNEITKKLYEGVKYLLKPGTSYDQFVSKSIMSSQKVGPTIADDIKKGAFLAVILSVLCIGAYIYLRFNRDLSYSVGTIAGLVLEAVMILGTYAALWGILPFSMEVDQTFLGALLTAIGYSVNDKVVVFDRIREHNKLYPDRDEFTLFNDSLNSTLDRTFNTAFGSLLVLLIIFFLAGDSIRSFCFTMILGIVYGTFCSLFVASPIAYEIQIREKKNASHKSNKTGKA